MSVQEEVHNYEQQIIDLWEELVDLLNEEYGSIYEINDYLSKVDFEYRGLNSGITAIATLEKPIDEYSRDDQVSVSNNVRGMFWHLQDHLEMDVRLALKIVGQEGERLTI